jgi:osmoprotectant transport system ATP-binding protein
VRVDTSVTVIEFRGAQFSVGGRTLVGPLDIAVERGETMVLLGESGSGKTTTLRLINRLLDPTEGGVVVEGRGTGSWDRVQLRRRIGYVIQEVGLFPHLSVEQNVGIVPRLEGWAGERIAGRVEELLTMVGLAPAEFRDRLPHRLSGGERQRVGVARALAADPPILLCDEPFGAVDPVTRSTLQREFSGLARRLEKTVVFVTHDVREATALADRIAVFDQGRICFVGTVEAFASDPTPTVRALRATG